MFLTGNMDYGECVLGAVGVVFAGVFVVQKYLFYYVEMVGRGRGGGRLGLGGGGVGGLTPVSERFEEQEEVTQDFVLTEEECDSIL